MSKLRLRFWAFSFPAASRIFPSMSAPLDFLKIFAGQLREVGIPFAITSGMACVHYGLQQTTKDSDWIIPAENEIAQVVPPVDELLP